jgi:phenylacetic acid degradation operon negative regulatory protein
MQTRKRLRTQFVTFVLLGDVVLPLGGQVWTASLLKMLKVLGVSERAARSAVSRMNRRGWLKPEREGRHSRYALTTKGRRILGEGGQRIFEPRKLEWNGEWHQIVYSLPEHKRRLRNDLRKRLAWLGFGRLAPGTWISPHDRRAEVQALVADLEAEAYVQYFTGLKLVDGNDRDIVERCWDLRTLNQNYARFLARWEPRYERCAQALVRGDGLAPDECFAQRFWITHEFSPFPREDPNLPAALLPAGWVGDKAVATFNGYRSLLQDRAAAFVTAAMAGPNGKPA